MKVKKISQNQIDSFLEGKKIAIAGVSRNPKKFGHQIYTELSQKGFTILPINPNTDNFNGEKCYLSVDELPKDVDSLLIVTPKNLTDTILREAIKKGIKNIWVQNMSETAETLRIAEEYQKEIIFGKCIFMFAEPVKSIHRFHRALVSFFGALPKYDTESLKVEQ